MEASFSYVAGKVGAAASPQPGQAATAFSTGCAVFFFAGVSFVAVFAGLMGVGSFLAGTAFSVALFLGLYPRG